MPLKLEKIAKFCFAVIGTDCHHNPDGYHYRFTREAPAKRFIEDCHKWGTRHVTPHIDGTYGFVRYWDVYQHTNGKQTVRHK